MVPKHLRTLLERLATAGVTEDFYLAGGTGLALLLGHRRSVDLDFFSKTNRLDFSGRRALLSSLRSLRGWALLEAMDGTLHGRLGRVRVSFFWYPEPLLKPPRYHGRVQLASMEDIALMKLGAIIGRGSRKDFVDLYTICQRMPLRRLLALAPKKFKDSRDFPWQALKALSFFEDAERDPPIVTPVTVSWREVKGFFIREVRSLARQYLGK